MYSNRGEGGARKKTRDAIQTRRNLHLPLYYASLSPHPAPTHLTRLRIHFARDENAGLFLHPSALLTDPSKLTLLPHMPSKPDSLRGLADLARANSSRRTEPDRQNVTFSAVFLPNKAEARAICVQQYGYIQYYSNGHSRIILYCTVLYEYCTT